MLARTWVLPLAAALLPSAGCVETPSFRARWSICEAADGCADGAEPHAPPLTAPAQCSFVGIGGVRVTTTDAAGFLADVREHSCFPRSFDDPDAGINGPELPPGTYDVEVRGLRRHRRQGPVDAEGNSPTIEDWSDALGVPLVIDAAELEVSAGETVELLDFELAPPPECDDGIDNDRDGFTDLFDPACSFGLENIDITTTQFRVEVGLLDWNPNARCTGLGIDAFRLRLDDDTTLHPPIECPQGELGKKTPILFSANLEPGDYVGLIDAVDRMQNPVTVAKEFPFTVRSGGGLVQLTADFDDADFLEPIVERARFTLGFRSHPEAVVRFCAEVTNQSALTIAEIGVRVVDAHGGDLPEPVTLDDGTVLDGTPLPCTAAQVSTDELSWGGYLMYVEAYSPEGELCFSTGDTPYALAPGENTVLTGRPPGDLPSSCIDCVDDGDCDGTCVDSACLPAG